MKKSILYFAMMAFLSVSIMSCTGDEPEKAEKAELVGTWQLTNVDFSLRLTTGRPASDACIVELISGYEFKADSSFYFILGDDGFFDPYKTQYWNWSGDVSNFKINQPNAISPPYNFAITPQNLKIEKVDSKWIMSFNADLSNGSKAKFKLVKQDLDLAKNPTVTDVDGSNYRCGFFDKKP